MKLAKIPPSEPSEITNWIFFLILRRITKTKKVLETSNWSRKWLKKSRAIATSLFGIWLKNAKLHQARYSKSMLEMNSRLMWSRKNHSRPTSSSMKASRELKTLKTFERTKKILHYRGWRIVCEKGLFDTSRKKNFKPKNRKKLFLMKSQPFQWRNSERKEWFGKLFVNAVSGAHLTSLLELWLRKFTSKNVWKKDFNHSFESITLLSYSGLIWLLCTTPMLHKSSTTTTTFFLFQSSPILLRTGGPRNREILGFLQARTEERTLSCLWRQKFQVSMG